MDGGRIKDAFCHLKNKPWGTAQLNDFFYQEFFLHFLKMTQRDNEWFYVFENISCFEKE